ncbi:MAG: glycosyltransferase, partial [Cyanobacteriota bacterium]|nr:glycosyltransferase [Cyanobacteriota bacterium]
NFGVQDRRSKTAFGLWRALHFAQQKRKFKLIVMFHELTLTFKLKEISLFHPLHFVAARGLARMADAVLTNSTRFREMLSELTQSPVACLPNFSTFGEPEQIPALPERNRRMLVLGTIYSRPRVYRTRLKELLTACRTLGIQEIYDIGPPFNIEVDNAEWGEIDFVPLGVQPPETIAQLMLSSQAGFLDYSSFPGDLGKSAVFAAYCAHGLLTVSSQYNPSEADGLEMNKHYVVPNESLKKMTLNDLQAIVENARQWYETHSLAEHAKFFASALLS